HGGPPSLPDGRRYPREGREHKRPKRGGVLLTRALPHAARLPGVRRRSSRDGEMGKRRVRSRMIHAVAIGSLVLPLMWVAPSAHAHHATRSDGNDTPGRLDISSASVGHSETSAVTHTIRTYQRWSPDVLRHGSFFAVGFS